MRPLKKQRERPEAKIQKQIIDFLTVRGWYVMPTHGNMYQMGFPDLYATHSKYGARWIEVKNPTAYAFTPAQLECFPKLTANGTRIWILIAATESEYAKLFKSANWYTYLMNMRGVT
jgi:hypothetical protein